MRLNASKIDLDIVTDSISTLDIRVLDAQINNESARELGPLKYMAELTGQPMAIIVNWFMMLIIFVFDPLAIGMIVAANMAFANIKGVARDPKDYEVYQPEVIIEKEIPVEVEEKIDEELEDKVDPKFQQGLDDAIKHLRRSGIKIPKQFWRKDP